MLTPASPMMGLARFAGEGRTSGTCAGSGSARGMHRRGGGVCLTQPTCGVETLAYVCAGRYTPLNVR